MAVIIHSDEFVKGLDEFLEGFVQGVAKATELACTEVENRAKEKAHKKNSTGELSQSLKHATQVQGNTVSGVVGSDQDYAVYVHEGTGQFARKGDGRPTPWTWYSESRDRFVRTSGYKANPFLEAAADEAHDRIAQIFQATILGGANG